MKSDISIPNPVFHAAEILARKMGVSLSELYTAAITTYVTKYQQEDITERLNRVFETDPSTVEPEMVKMQVLSIGGEENWKSLDNIPARVPGIDKGKVIIMPDFDAPLPEFEE